MNTGIDPIVLYIKERIQFYPWGILPLIIFFVGHGPIQFHYIALYNLLWGVFFFRVLDDYFCFESEKKSNSESYYRLGKSPILILVFLFGLLFFSSVILIYKMHIATLAFVIIIHMLIFYRVLRETKWIRLVTLLHYPFLFYIIADYTEAPSYFWALCGALFFVLKNILEQIYQKRYIQIELIIITLLVGSKLALRFL